MSSVIDPRVAVRSTLAAYLGTALAGNWPLLVVSENWPTPQIQLPAQAVTVLAVGAPRTFYHQPVTWQTTPTTGHNGTALYSYGWAEIDLQIDAWSQHEAARDLLVRDVELAITQSAAVTLATTTTPEYSMVPGLALAMSNFYGAPADFVFSSVPSSQAESSSAAMTADWRATWEGTATIWLLNQETVALMQTITANIAFNGQPAVAVQLYP